MDLNPVPSAGSKHVSARVRSRILRGGERLWRLADFGDLPFAAVAQTLSRLSREGVVERLSKGVYYRNRETPFGKSRPNSTTIQNLAPHRKTVFPSGTAAANLLGFSTQSPRRREVATTALSLPRKLIGAGTIVHTRRPEAWAKLSVHDAAILDFLRRAGKESELSPEKTVERTLLLLNEEDRFERLLAVAPTEPPRVRAMLGAFGAQLGKNDKVLKRLRTSLNPFSRFDFGKLAAIPNAGDWQAKKV